MNKRYWVIGSLAILALLALYPFESTVVPEWKLEVRDVNGNLCRDMRVTESHAHYSLFLGPNGGTEDQYTDSNGIVVFPEKTVRAIGLRRVVVPIIAHILIIAHGSVGPSGAVWATGLKDVAWLSYKPGKPLPYNMRVEECLPRVGSE
ncbi:MAG: hypothetical protein KF736_01925 [Acidobacteria bacterium]|nr:hypothetical protein [Acidobacteriota bacterium]MCW5948236.1 hypothetical protein [Pyrinomonadaceae bacterium]